ncbi:tetratricopeptide repeat protein [Bradyrhizobium huanghuaihaiense]|uniref:tetratricopeptide repeat protein n=1 Tax=Bradyrhizobium huanghuaihaiense TaxID=990078 RepID=UPI0021AA89A4|nr:tetratricopeptide repeat protein [Bradyrhizobium sp. CB3035]UWU73221.1 tetratricopeptide repeat protein [Bradyrhizobium sp. CB3035]
MGIVSDAAVNPIVLQAAEHFAAGRPDEADALCAEVLKAEPDHVPALHLAAVAAFVSDRAAEGAALLGRIFSVDPEHAPALVTLGDALAVKGEQEGAVAAFRRALVRRPDDAGLHNKLGVALGELARFDEAEAAYRRALALDAHLTRACFNLAVVLAEQGRLAEADEAYRAVIAREPSYRGVWLNLGNLLIDQVRLGEAEVAYRHALDVDPDDPGVLCNLGAALYRQGSLEDAIVQYRRAIALAPDNAPALRLLGLVLHEAGHLQEAAEAYRRSFARDPSDNVIASNLGACLSELGELDEAISACEHALLLKPDHAPAWTNLGIIFEKQERAADAVAAHRCAVVADPKYAKGHANLAVALRNAGEIDEALAVSHRAIALDPEQPLAQYNHAHFLLMNGHFAEGFDAYRWRWRCKMLSDGDPVFAEPEWQGEPLDGRTLLLFAEYGLGDALHFVRYVSMVAAKGGRIVLQVQPALAGLLQQLSDVTVIPRGVPLPPFDLQLPLMSLPRIFGTTLDTVPADVPYLHPELAKLSRWRAALADVTALKVGVVWAGNARHKGDRQRSLSAEAVLPRLVMPGVQLYSLQKEPRPEDAAVLAALGTDIIDLAPALGDFADTAAAVAALDLVIAVDTSVAHLAGALGRTVWMLTPYALDWRWLRDREDSPWYPTMRLFRQRSPREWDDPLLRLSAALAVLAASAESWTNACCRSSIADGATK